MIWVTGDIHGDLSRFQASPLRHLRKGDSLIICGDFGFLWNGTPEEEKILDKLSRKKYQILFVDGTHENFDLLESYPVEDDFCGGKVRRIRDNIFQLMRGQVYTMEGRPGFHIWRRRRGKIPAAQRKRGPTGPAVCPTLTK